MDDHEDTPRTEGEGWSLPATETYRHVRHDGTERRVEFDPALWVELDGDRGYIEGNAHTHPGRFHVYFPESDDVTTASAYELTAMSREARYWLLGFLAGSEPDLSEYLGCDGWVQTGGSGAYRYTDEELVRWSNFCKQFHRDGTHISLQLRPDRALVITDEERAKINLDPWHPWSYVGERVLIPAGPGSSEWVEADPQPEMDWGMLVGSVCYEQRHHKLMWLESGWTVCRDCGEVDVVWDVDNVDAGVYRKVDNR